MNGIIESIAFGGKGVARVENKVYFVPFTAPGDEVTFEVIKDKKTYAEGSLVQINTPSHERREPRCPHFKKCGGCTLQHMNYSAQLAAKKQILHDAFERIGKLPRIDITIHPSPEEWGYRRHIRLNLRPFKAGYMGGYVGHNPQEFVQISQCDISPFPPAFFNWLQNSLKELSNERIENCTLRIFHHENAPILAFSSTPCLPKNHRKWAEQSPYPVLFKSPKGMTRHGEIPETINPFGFSQCNTEVAEALYSHITHLVSQEKRLLDLYGGAGSLALDLVRKGKDVTLIEENISSCEQAKSQAKKLNIPLDVWPGRVEEYTFQKKYDATLVNPPREGISPEALERILSAKIPHLIYTSCMPSTLARDLKKIVEAGYTIVHADAFDMFPQTTHIETVIFCRLG